MARQGWLRYDSAGHTLGAKGIATRSKDATSSSYYFLIQSVPLMSGGATVTRPIRVFGPQWLLLSSP